MALQKRRMGKARIHSRRSAWMRRQAEAASTTVAKCTNCQADKLPHRVCETCGFYGGRQVIEVAQEAFDE